MQKFVFSKVSTHYVTVEAHSLEQAERIAAHIVIVDDEVKTAEDDDWELVSVTDAVAG